jgi:hypothetical protein
MGREIGQKSGGYSTGVFGWGAIGRTAIAGGVALLLWGAVVWTLMAG